MSLKAHVIDSATIAEEQIEAIIAGRANYDIKEKTVVIARQKVGTTEAILTYLVALKGWRFVLEGDLPPEDASPKEIAKATGLSAGSTNPTLIKLATAGLVINRKGRYSASHNLHNIKSVVEGDAPATASGLAHKKQGRKKMPSDYSKV